MLRIIVDSGSSIKQAEKEALNVDILPLKILFGEDEYEDDKDLSMDLFYHRLIEQKEFPKTSLPNMDYAQQLVDKYTAQGDDILFIAFSSGLSGTSNVLHMMFKDYPNVRVVDSLSAVGGIRILVEEANKHRDESLDQIFERLENLKKRIRILAVPETLTYLLRGGRLSKKEWLLGTIIAIKPIISVIDGKAKVISKKRGLKNAMKHINELMNEFGVDMNYPIVAEYSYNIDNINDLIECLEPEYKSQISCYDEIDCAVACHWGPNAFGLIFIENEQQ